jgi:hypothetical protein
MRWLHHDFRNYCELKGLQILRDDMRFIERRLTEIHPDSHRRVMREYVRIWIQALSEGQGQGQGRVKANQYLRGED